MTYNEETGSCRCCQREYDFGDEPAGEEGAEGAEEAEAEPEDTVAALTTDDDEEGLCIEGCEAL